MVKENKTAKKICQSCGMPLIDDDEFGTNADGTKNEEYCNFCFQKGAFTDEGITLEQKIEKNVKFACEMGVSEEEARELANELIPKLRRWKKG